MRPQSLMVGILALVFGGSAIVGVNSFIRNRGEAVAASDMVSVVVTAMDLPRGGTITAELVSTRDYPTAMVPAGVAARVAAGMTTAPSNPLRLSSVVASESRSLM